MGQTLSEPVVEKVCGLSYTVVNIQLSMRYYIPCIEPFLLSECVHRDEGIFN